jgi:hypothetical protein
MKSNQKINIVNLMGYSNAEMPKFETTYNKRINLSNLDKYHKGFRQMPFFKEI